MAANLSFLHVSGQNESVHLKPLLDLYKKNPYSMFVKYIITKSIIGYQCTAYDPSHVQNLKRIDCISPWTKINF